VQSEYLTETFHKLTYYLAGPMSGIPQFNYPKFHKITKELRDAGYTVINPVEEDSPELQDILKASKDGLVEGKHHYEHKVAVAGETWGDVLARDIQTIFNRCDGVVVMDGWEKSRGARLEVFVANLCGRSINVYRGSGVIEGMSEGEYLRGITGATAVLMGGSDYGRN
jgi:hypothetical protein